MCYYSAAIHAHYLSLPNLSPRIASTCFFVRLPWLLQWGHNFRPDYLRLADFAKAAKANARLALTATATPRVGQALLGSRLVCLEKTNTKSLLLVISVFRSVEAEQLFFCFLFFPDTSFASSHFRSHVVSALSWLPFGSTGFDVSVAISSPQRSFALPAHRCDGRAVFLPERPPPVMKAPHAWGQGALSKF